MGGGLNASGLASLMRGQGSNIDSAMPKGFADQLNSQGFLSSITDSASGAASAVASTAKGAASSVAGAASGAASSASAGVGNFGGGGGDNGDDGSPMWKKILPIVGLLLLGWIGLKPNQTAIRKDTVADATEPAKEVAADAKEETAEVVTAVSEAATDTTENATETAEAAADH